MTLYRVPFDVIIKDNTCIMDVLLQTIMGCDIQNTDMCRYMFYTDP